MAVSSTPPSRIFRSAAASPSALICRMLVGRATCQAWLREVPSVVGAEGGSCPTCRRCACSKDALNGRGAQPARGHDGVDALIPLGGRQVVDDVLVVEHEHA